MQLQWGRRKDDRPYIKNKPHKLSGVHSSLVSKGIQVLHFKKPHGFKNHYGLKIRFDGLYDHDPKTKLFVATVRDVWNHEPQIVREEVKEIVFSKTNPKKLAGFDTDTKRVEFCMPSGMKINEYGQIVRHELDHVFLWHVTQHHLKKFMDYMQKVKEIPPMTVILENLHLALKDTKESGNMSQFNKLEEEYFHEFFAETGQYIYQKEHGLDHYNLTNPEAMTKAIQAYNSLIKLRH